MRSPHVSLLLLLLPAFSGGLRAQASDSDPMPLPYAEIPAYPDSLSPEAVIARMIDGLGFRYYWATEGLRPEDLAWVPSEGARSSAETLTHIEELSALILNAVRGTPHVRGGSRGLGFEELRRETLLSLQMASEALRSPGASLDSCRIIFQQGERRTEFPCWHLLNGPLADALWHVGQVVSLRRASGNPLPAHVNVFLGKAGG